MKWLNKLIQKYTIPAFSFDSIFHLAVTTFIQGYLENDRIKLRTGAIMLSTIRSLDQAGLLTDNFVHVISTIYQAYDITDAQAKELDQLVGELTKQVEMESVAVDILFKEHMAKKRSKKQHEER